jgi:hypothetical protein
MSFTRASCAGLLVSLSAFAASSAGAHVVAQPNARKALPRRGKAKRPTKCRLCQSDIESSRWRGVREHRTKLRLSPTRHQCHCDTVSNSIFARATTGDAGDPVIPII